jgi:hypothetical protein
MTTKTRDQSGQRTRKKAAVKKGSAKKASRKKTSTKKATTKKATTEKATTDKTNLEKPAKASRESGTTKKTSVRMTSAPQPKPGAVTGTRVTVRDQTAGLEMGEWSKAPAESPSTGEARRGWDAIVENQIRPLIHALKSPIAPKDSGVLSHVPMGAWVIASFASGFLVGCLVAWVL